MGLGANGHLLNLLFERRPREISDLTKLLRRRAKQAHDVMITA